MCQKQTIVISGNGIRPIPRDMRQLPDLCPPMTYDEAYKVLQAFAEQPWREAGGGECHTYDVPQSRVWELRIAIRKLIPETDNPHGNHCGCAIPVILR
jgi:hypothetical protein